MLDSELNKAYVRLFSRQNSGKMQAATHGTILHAVSLLYDALCDIDTGDTGEESVYAALFELIGIYMVKEEPNE